MGEERGWCTRHVLRKRCAVSQLDRVVGEHDFDPGPFGSFVATVPVLGNSLARKGSAGLQSAVSRDPPGLWQQVEVAFHTQHWA